MKHPYLIAALCCSLLIVGSITFGYIALRTVEPERHDVPTPSQPTASTSTDTDTDPGVVNDCVIGGCSRQLCMNAATANDIVSTCEYRASYACYQEKSARCERQTDGTCGWTQTETLIQCLRDADGMPVR